MKIFNKRIGLVTKVIRKGLKISAVNMDCAKDYSSIFVHYHNFDDIDYIDYDNLEDCLNDFLILIRKIK